jgi:DNA replication initiation complex subunit (GINS family)
MTKQDKFKLEEEMMREYRELQGYVATAIAAEVCKIIPDHFVNNGSSNNRSPRPDPDASKAAEARQNSAQSEAERLGPLRASRPNGPPNPRHPHDQAPR